MLGHFATRAVHAGQETAAGAGSSSVVPDIALTTTFKQDEPAIYKYGFCTQLQTCA